MSRVYENKEKMQYSWINMVAFRLKRWSSSVPAVLCVPTTPPIEMEYTLSSFDFGLAYDLF